MVVNLLRRRHLAVIKGMLNEFGPRKERLSLELQKNPGSIDYIHRLIGSLEGEMDALLLALQFIDEETPLCKRCHSQKHCSKREDPTGDCAFA